MENVNLENDLCQQENGIEAEYDPFIASVQTSINTMVQEVDQALRDFSHNRIVIHVETFDRMRAIAASEKVNAADILYLYSFYFRCARKQETNQPWANDTFCRKGIGWTKTRFYKTKKVLLENGFIEQIRRRTEDKKRLKQFFIKVNHMPITNLALVSQKRRHNESLPVENLDTNALMIVSQMLEKNNNNNPVVENVPIGNIKIPRKIIDKYGEDAVKERIRNMPSNAVNPIGWIKDACEKGYGKDRKVPPRAIPAEKVPTDNGPGVHWDEGDNSRVRLGNTWYQETRIENETFYIPTG